MRDRQQILDAQSVGPSDVPDATKGVSSSSTVVRLAVGLGLFWQQTLQLRVHRVSLYSPALPFGWRNGVLLASLSCTFAMT
jgi:hypothetical protein